MYSTKSILERYVESNHKIIYPGNVFVISRDKVKAPSDIKCPFCIKKYTSEQGLNLHIKNYHKPKNDKNGVIVYGTMFGVWKDSQLLLLLIKMM